MVLTIINFCIFLQLSYLHFVKFKLLLILTDSLFECCLQNFLLVELSLKLAIL